MACILFVFCLAAAIVVPAQTFTSLVSFDGTTGANPLWTALAQGRDGNFYGTTSGGGIYGNGCSRGPDGSCGTVFKITPAGTLTTLHRFQNGADGSGPMPGLVLATDGNFYGANSNGGNFSYCFGIGCGAAFKIEPNGTLFPLFDFTFSSGANPNSALVQALNGEFYGTTVNGGIAGSGIIWDGGGAIFEMTSAGALTVLHNFDFSDGWDPVNAAMIQASDGNFYGEAPGGGASSNCSNNCGTVFRITPSGTFTLLHSFLGSDGGGPEGGLVQYAGNFYGTTNIGGANNDGTVFEMTPAGNVTTLHSFDGTDGSGPEGGLVLATDGNLYGTTTAGGANGDGTIFEITPGGTLTTLHNFSGTDGSEPYSVLLQATNGTFYGTTVGGGTSGDGTVFSLSTGLGPFVTFLPAARPVGGIVQILGQGFTGTTGVSFNGTPAATFTVESDTFLRATIPAGATTGSITVTTPGGTLQSNNSFRVTPQILSFNPPSGPVGTSVVITGESFTGATEVVFSRGAAASFTVNSDTQITATVPAGTVSGVIGVLTPGGNAASATSFSVTP